MKSLRGWEFDEMEQILSSAEKPNSYDVGHAQEFMKAGKFDEAHELLKRVQESAAEMISEGESQIELG